MSISTGQIRCAAIMGAAAVAIMTTATATAQGGTCKAARAVARIVPGRRACGPATGGCTVRGFTCLVGQAGKELYFARCENSAQTQFIRFEYGS